MAKRYLEYYHEQNSIIETNPETGEVSFILKNENNSIMKEYNKNLTKPEGYLHVNFSKRIYLLHLLIHMEIVLKSFLVVVKD